MTLGTPEARVHGETPDSGKKHRRRADIQGLRALAILLVVGYHAGLPIPGGFAGVDVFFVISGFVITGLLSRELGETGKLNLASFYSRRIRRILPAAGSMLIVTLVATALLMSPLSDDQANAAGAGRAASVFLANFWFIENSGGYFQADAATNPFLHMWSLSVEEQFYLAFPVLLGLLWIALRRLLLVWIALGACLAASMATAFQAVGSGAPDRLQFAFYHPFSRAWELLLGSLLALLAPRLKLASRAATGGAAAGALLIAVTAVSAGPNTPWPGPWALAPTVGTALLLMAGNQHNPVSSLLSARPMRFLGDVSYSWYVWHWPALVFAHYWIGSDVTTGLVASALSLGVAWLSFRFLENPIRERRLLPTGVGTVAIAATTIFVPALGATAILASHASSWGDPRLTQISAEVRRDVVPPGAGACNVRTVDISANSKDSPPPCVWKVPESRGVILVLGDSHAWHYTGPVVSAGNALGYDVQLSYMGSCPMVQVSTTTSAACQKLVDDALEALRGWRFSAVVMSHSNYLKKLAGPLVELDPRPDLGGTTQEKALRGWVSGLSSTIAQSRPGLPFIYIGDVPNGRAQPTNARIPQCLAPTIWAEPRLDCGYAPIGNSEIRGEIASAERVGLARFGNVAYLDLGGSFCPSGQIQCRTIRDDVPLQRDGNHLTYQAAMEFRNDIRDALAASLLGAP